MRDGGMERETNGIVGRVDGFGRCRGCGINGTSAVDKRGEKSMITPGRGLGFLADTGAICPS